MPEPSHVQQLQTALACSKQQLTLAEAEVENMRNDVWFRAGRLQEAEWAAQQSAPAPAPKPAPAPRAVSEAEATELAEAFAEQVRNGNGSPFAVRPPSSEPVNQE
jgi:hypothetical protein